MKVTYLHQYFNTPQMQGSTRSFEFARRLVAAGHEVHMVTSDQKRTGSPYQTDEEGIEVTWIPIVYSNKMDVKSRIRAFVTFAWVAGRMSAKIDSDVVFATSTPLTIALSGVYASKHRNIPMVFEVRDLWPEMPIALGILRDPISKLLAGQLERFAYRNSEHIVALSPGIKDGIVLQGYPESRISVIPNACDLDMFDVDAASGTDFRAKFDWLYDRPLVVYAGTIGKVNGVSYMVDLAWETRSLNPEIRFLVVGNGKEEAQVRAYAAQLGVLDDNFFMLPSMEKARIPQVLSAADIAISLFIDVPEMQSNSANKFFDTLASGTPIAINYGGWQADMIRERGIGLVLNHKDMSDSAGSLVEMLQDKTRMIRAAKSAHQLASTSFNREDLTLQLMHLLENVTSQRNQS